MNAPAAQSSTSSGWTSSERLLIGGSLLSMLAILCIVVYLLARERNDAMQSAARAATNTIKLIEADIQRNVELYDASLTGMLSAWNSPDLPLLSPALRQRLLFDRASAAPYKGDVALLDAQGDVLADPLPGTARQDNFADRRFFMHHRDSPLPGLYISEPFKARWGFNDWNLGFSRRLSGPNGEFRGVAIAAMRLAYFRPLFRSQSLDRDSSISLINASGVLLVREPQLSPLDQTGVDLSQLTNFQHILELPEGSFVGLSMKFESERLYTFSRVSGLPLIVVIAQPVSEVYATWRRNALLVGSATGALCLGILWLTFLLIGELRRRQQAEGVLANLAATDGLTGLPNRRQLDRTLAIEWARAQRSGEPLSLLLLDVDHFRRFNERHGHLGGDQALRQVADSIAAHVRRTSDLAARYGGEEFAVLLPDTDHASAHAMAEAIRQTVMQLPTFEHEQQAITVSIGVTTGRVGKGDTLESLIEAADKALYSAKNRGRNRVEFLEYAQTQTASPA